MKKSEKVSYIIDSLAELYPNPKASLAYKDPFTFLVAVALSAQSTDKKVNQVSPSLFARASKPKQMTKLSVAEIKEFIKETGLANSKAKNLKAMSQKLVDEINSVVPHTFTELESLPGLGHKTASVVMSEIFDIPVFPVDTHIHHLLWRWDLATENR